MFYTCTQPKSMLGTEIAKPKKTRIYPKTTNNNHLHTMLPKQKKYCLHHHSPLSKAHYILSMPHHFVSNKIIALILLICSLEHQQRLGCIIHIEIKSWLIFFSLFLVIYYVYSVYLKPLCSLGHDWDFGETTLERWLGDL